MSQTNLQPEFTVIYADPPWAYMPWAPPKPVKLGERVRHVRALPYPTVSTEDICSLPVESISAADSILFLWATYPMLPDALRVMAAWGFTFKTVGFTWVKQNPTGKGFHFGLGYWTRANPEICLVGVRGRPRRVSQSVPNLVISPRREHSRKPDEVRDKIIQLCGDVPRLELYARQKTPGWSVWGNEVTCDISLSAPFK